MISPMAQSRSVVTVGPQGRVVIPAPIRRSLGLAAGDELTLTIDGERLVLEPRAVAAARARGMFAHLATDVSVVDELLAERREEARRDDTG